MSDQSSRALELGRAAARRSADSTAEAAFAREIAEGELRDWPDARLYWTYFLDGWMESRRTARTRISIGY